MADIELVIKISEEDYEYCKRWEPMSPLAKAIVNSTPLPKGHGRIGDLDAISLDDISFFSIGDYQKMVRKLTDASTIIEADKER